jgi:predicted RND superfamily exporter protein
VFAFFDRAAWPRKPTKKGLLDKTVGGLFHIGMRRPVLVLASTLGLMAICLPFLKNVVVETNLLEFFTPGHKTRVATEHIQEKLAGTGSLDIVFTSSEPEGLATPANLRMIRNFQVWAESQPEVDKSQSFADFVEEMHWAFNAQRAGYRTIPDNADLISQYLFIYDGTDLYDFVDENFQLTRVSLAINVHGASDINSFMARLRQQLETNSPPDLQWEIAGISRMFADQVDLLVKGQVESIVAALVIIFLLMVVQWRSFKDAVICMIPNLSPILLIFILMGAFNIWLDVATAMIASVAVGIAIDDTIHVYHGFIHRVRRGVNPTVALARTYRQAGRAIMTTTVILCAQFLVLATSNFIPVRNFGLLTSIGLAAALIFDLFLLPAILILVYRPHAKSKLA